MQYPLEIHKLVHTRGRFPLYLPEMNHVFSAKLSTWLTLTNFSVTGCWPDADIPFTTTVLESLSRPHCLPDDVAIGYYPSTDPLFPPVPHIDSYIDEQYASILPYTVASAISPGTSQGFPRLGNPTVVNALPASDNHDTHNSSLKDNIRAIGDNIQAGALILNNNAIST